MVKTPHNVQFGSYTHSGALKSKSAWRIETLLLVFVLVFGVSFIALPDKPSDMNAYLRSYVQDHAPNILIMTIDGERYQIDGPFTEDDCDEALARNKGSIHTSLATFTCEWQ